MSDLDERHASLIERVMDLMGERRWREAIALCAAAPSSDLTPEILWNWGWAHFKVGEPSTAKALLHEANNLRPEHAATLWALGVVLHQLGLLPQAKMHLRRSLELKESTTCRLNLALVLMEESDFAAAEQVHLEGLRLQPTSGERLEAYGDFLSDAGRLEEAAVQYSRAKASLA